MKSSLFSVKERKMKIIVTGGVGYIGSVVVRELLRRSQYDLIVVDSLVAYKDRPDHLSYWKANVGFSGKDRHIAAFYQGDCTDEKFMDNLFTENGPIDAVVHLAAFISVEDSMSEPLVFYRNNIDGMLSILSVMRRHSCKTMVFSSSCTAAVMPGGPDSGSAPPHAYGYTKLWGEKIIETCCNAYGMKCIALRFFNASGASSDGDIGECHEPEVHLIPCILRSLLPSKRPREEAEGGNTGGKVFTIFGTDFPTRDGTCVRDYVHVEDLARAHFLSLQFLFSKSSEKDGFFDIVHLGSGNGHSVKEVFSICEEVTGRHIPMKLGDRRPGDAASAFCDTTHALELIGWKPECDLRSIVSTAWKFHQRFPSGYVQTK